MFNCVNALLSINPNGIDHVTFPVSAAQHGMTASVRDTRLFNFLKMIKFIPNASAQ